jgi:lipopolysaccharide export system protein LptA
MRARSPSRLAAFALLLVAALACAAGSVAADSSASAASGGLTIGVAPFERRSAPDIVLPPIDQLLADRIGTRGVGKIVGPEQIAASADAEPSSEDVKAWSSQAGVAALVVGRITRIGIPVSVDVRLHSAATGEVLGTYVGEVLEPEQLDAVVDDLALQVLAGAAGSAPEDAPAVSAAPSPKSEGAFGIAFDSDRPVSIRADQLESVRSNGARKLLFTNNVVVVQDDVTIHSNRLEAFYPPESSQPEKMVATGRVRMKSPKNEARCDRATYEKSKDMLVCRGNAELREGGDCVAGEWIEFDLESETVRVGGGAKVVIGGSGAPRQGSCQ